MVVSYMDIICLQWKFQIFIPKDTYLYFMARFIFVIKARDVSETLLPPPLETSVKKMNWNCIYWNFLRPRGITLLKFLKINTQNQTWPRYYNDKSVYQISFHYVQPLWRKWTDPAKNWNFSKSKEKNCSILPLIKFDLLLR